MVELKFEVNDYYLASYIIQYNRASDLFDYAVDKYRKDIVAFQNLAYDFSKDMCRVIEGRYSLKDYLFLDNNLTQNLTTQITDYLDEIIKSDEFITLKQQTEESVVLCKKEWEKNFEKTDSYIKGLGIDISGEFTVFMIHPAMRAGQYKLNNKIVWSYQTHWNNCNTVYLWHEVLHSYFDFSENSHALIELITDEQMRVLLNGGTYPPFVSDKLLADVKNKMLPTWRKYLKSNSKDIAKLQKEFSKINPST